MENREILPNQVYDSNQSIPPSHRVPAHCRDLSEDKIRHIRRLNIPLNRFQEALLRRAVDAKSALRFMNIGIHDRVFEPNNTFDMEERKTYISSRRMYSWHEKLYGITRVAVYGVDTICVATRNRDLVQLEGDLQRVRDGRYWLSKPVPSALISEVEDLECLSGESRHKSNKSSQKPFGVVSVIPGKNKAHKLSGDEASRSEYGEEKAIKFLQKKMNSTATFTTSETIKTAVCALQHLFLKKFKPHQIQVFVRKRESDTVEELNIHEERGIEDILTVINKPPSAGSGSRSSQQILVRRKRDRDTVEQLNTSEELNIKDLLAVTPSAGSGSRGPQQILVRRKRDGDTVEQWDITDERVIKDILAVINKPHSAGSVSIGSQQVLFQKRDGDTVEQLNISEERYIKDVLAVTHSAGSW